MKKLLLISIIFTAFYSFSQSDSLTRPKIGLVLSGGGAKGLAHIGVLKALEKFHIHPDYIGGTSMGAIVGSLYAMGYNACQLDSIFHHIPFEDVLYNRLDRKYKSMFKKERGERFIFSFPFSLKKMSVQLPRGLSDSQRMFNVLAENMYPVHNLKDFSKLKIPFICISTDIVSGKQVLFNQGYLPAAVTASALLPSVFKPLDKDNKLLLDGGIVNNYPLKEVKDLGGEYIIGSDVQGNILKKKDINGMSDILEQIISFGMYKEMPLKKAQTNLYIHPDITGIGLTDFDKIDTIIKRGEKAATQALLQRDDLSKLQSGKPFSALHYQKPDSLVFDQIIIEGAQNFSRDYVLGKIGLRPRQKISYKDFLDGINNLIGSDNFEKIHYRFLTRKNQNDLKLDLKERQHKASFNIGFHYNDLYNINVIVNFENKRIITNNDLISIDLIGGNYFRYNFDYLIDNGFKMSIGFHSGLHRFTHSVDAQEIFRQENFSINKLDFNYFQLTNKLYFQGNANHFIYLRLGLQHAYKKLYTYVFSSREDEAFYFGKNHYFGNFASLNLDSRNDCYFPTKGIYLKLKWTYNWASSDFYGDFKPFSIYMLDFNWTQKINRYWLIQPTIQSGLFYSTDYTYDNIFYLGGMNSYQNFDQIIHFTPMQELSVSATKFTIFGFTNLIPIQKKQFLKLGGHMLFYDQSIQLLPSVIKQLYGYNISYGIKTFLGPLILNYGHVPQLKKQYIGFSFGYEF